MDHIERCGKKRSGGDVRADGGSDRLCDVPVGERCPQNWLFPHFYPSACWSATSTSHPCRGHFAVVRIRYCPVPRVILYPRHSAIDQIPISIAAGAPGRLRLALCYTQFITRMYNVAFPFVLFTLYNTQSQTCALGHRRDTRAAGARSASPTLEYSLAPKPPRVPRAHEARTACSMTHEPCTRRARPRASEGAHARAGGAGSAASSPPLHTSRYIPAGKLHRLDEPLGEGRLALLHAARDEVIAVAHHRHLVPAAAHQVVALRATRGGRGG